MKINIWNSTILHLFALIFFVSIQSACGSQTEGFATKSNISTNDQASIPSVANDNSETSDASSAPPGGPAPVTSAPPVDTSYPTEYVGSVPNFVDHSTETIADYKITKDTWPRVSDLAKVKFNESYFQISHGSVEYFNRTLSFACGPFELINGVQTITDTKNCLPLAWASNLSAKKAVLLRILIPPGVNSVEVYVNPINSGQHAHLAATKNDDSTLRTEMIRIAAGDPGSTLELRGYNATGEVPAIWKGANEAPANILAHPISAIGTKTANNTSARYNYVLVMVHTQLMTIASLEYFYRFYDVNKFKAWQAECAVLGEACLGRDF